MYQGDEDESKKTKCPPRNAPKYEMALFLIEAPSIESGTFTERPREGLRPSDSVVQLHFDRV